METSRKQFSILLVSSLIKFLAWNSGKCLTLQANDDFSLCPNASCLPNYLLIWKSSWFYVKKRFLERPALQRVQTSPPKVFIISSVPKVYTKNNKFRRPPLYPPSLPAFLNVVAGAPCIAVSRSCNLVLSGASSKNPKAAAAFFELSHVETYFWTTAFNRGVFWSPLVTSRSVKPAKNKPINVAVSRILTVHRRNSLREVLVGETPSSSSSSVCGGTAPKSDSKS